MLFVVQIVPLAASVPADRLLPRRLRPQTDADGLPAGAKLLPGRLLPQADALSPAAADVRLPGRLLSQADAVSLVSASLAVFAVRDEREDVRSLFQAIGSLNSRPDPSQKPTSRGVRYSEPRGFGTVT